MRIALFGGTGFVGSHVVDALCAAQHEVSLLVRPGSENKVPNTTIWRTTPGDLNNDAALDETVLACDAVIYSVGLLREFPKRHITFENTQYEGVVRAAAAARRANVQRFVLISANGIKRPGTPYQETKLRAEEHISASGLDTTIFRPSVIFGDPRGTMEFATQLYRDMVASPVPALGFFSGFSPNNGQILMSPAYVGDVAAAICNSLGQKSAIGKTFTLGGPEALSWPEMIRRIAAAANRQKWILPMPIGPMKLAASLLDWLPFFPVTRDQLIMLAENNVADPATLEKLANRPLKAFDATSLSYLND
ncbi:MAG: NAD(P)H-binding protein [Gammaproteobacteria bacterium]|nr:NAD(P)H-binding protein [Gammaproteobacteria bacterium]MDH3416599.1 NAD(P)H-binding protein [Gammaproteobacteria bacterium]